jgi:hypothetical protein
VKLKMYHLKTVGSTNLKKFRKPAALCISIIFIAGIFAASTARADSGATIDFSSGFENGFENNFDGWTATYGSPTIVSSPVYSGNKAMLCSNPYSSQAYISGVQQSHMFAQAKFMLTKNMVGMETLIAFFDSNDFPAATLMINVVGGGVYLGVMTLLPSYSYAQYDVTGSLSANTWFLVALESSSSGCTIYFNGVAVQSVSKQDFPSIGAVSIGMFWGEGSYTGNLYVDNVQITIPSTWSRTFGGTDVDSGRSVVQTSDGGYAVAGYTFSLGAGSDDVYLVKTDARGTMLWNKTYGGKGDDKGYSVVQTCDGGYAVAGYTQSFGTGIADVYLVKTDASGNMVWNKTYGVGTNDDEGQCVVETADGGYAIAGYTTTYGAGDYHVYLVKTDSAGTIQWNKTYGETGEDRGYSVIQTPDGGYAIGGETSPGPNMYLVKTDASGNMMWSKTFGGTNPSVLSGAVIQASDGGYVIAGRTYDYGAGNNDVYLVKTDASGTLLWSKTYGGTRGDSGNSLFKTSDDGYVIAGHTYSYGAGSFDAYLVKTDASGTMLWNKTYGGTGNDVGYSVIQTSDGGYAMVGDTFSFGAGNNDVYLVKTDVNGNLA